MALIDEVSRVLRFEARTHEWSFSLHDTVLTLDETFSAPFTLPLFLLDMGRLWKGRFSGARLPVGFVGKAESVLGVDVVLFQPNPRNEAYEEAVCEIAVLSLQQFVARLRRMRGSNDPIALNVLYKEWTKAVEVGAVVVHQSSEVLFDELALRYAALPRNKNAFYAGKRSHVKADPQQQASQAKMSRRPTALDEFATDMVAASRAGAYAPLIGREEELSLAIETLCRTEKRNPLLIGEAGVGKTAIVEGLANRIASGNVPSMLKDALLYSIPQGVMKDEAKLSQVLAAATNLPAVLFFDEIHVALIGEDSARTSRVAQQLKPLLSRGVLAVIGATTLVEYRQFVESDKAMERRFAPIRISEMSPSQSRAVLVGRRERISSARGVAIPDAILDAVIDGASRHLRNRLFPDKAVELLDACVGRAVSQGLGELTLDGVQETIRRLVGVPAVSGDALDHLDKRLSTEGHIPVRGAQEIAARLRVAMSGFDIRVGAPNAVIALAGAAVPSADPLACAFSKVFYGTETNVVDLEFSQFQREDRGLTALFGIEAGYFGAEKVEVPLHRVREFPWSVVVCRNVDRSLPLFRSILAQGFRKGYFVDGMRRRIYLSDSIFILTVQAGPEFGGVGSRGMGFVLDEPMADGGEGELQHWLEDAISVELAALVDVVITDEPSMIAQAHVAAAVRSRVAELCAGNLVALEWDSDLEGWLSSPTRRLESPAELDRFIERHILHAIVGCMHGVNRRSGEWARVRISMADGGVKAECQGLSAADGP